MLKICVMFLSVMLLCAPVSLAEEADAFSTSYTCADLKGNYRWKAATEINHSDGDPDDVFQLVEKGRGHYSGFEDKISWSSVMRFQSTDETVRPIRVDKRVFDTNGILLMLETQEFDYTDNKIKCSKQDKVNDRETVKEFDFGFDPVNRLSLSLYIQKFLKNGFRQKKVNLLSSEPNIYSVSIKIIGEEVIDIYGKQLKAYKLCLDPNLGILSIFKVFLPKSYTWHLAKEDFAWLKYEGPESDPASIKVIIETKG